MFARNTALVAAFATCVSAAMPLSAASGRAETPPARPAFARAFVRALGSPTRRNVAAS